MAIGPAFSSTAANTDPSSSQPRFGVTSLHGASGPSVGAQRAARRHEPEADERGEGDGEAVGAGARDPDEGEADAQR